MEVIFKLDNIKEAAEKILADSSDYKVFAFTGAMGAGKTTLIHALCETLGVEGNISSPTFSIINQYTTKTGNTIYHLDLYRLKDENEAFNAGIEDCLYSGNTCMVEWPERVPGIFPVNTRYLTLKILSDDTRKIIF